MKNIGMVVAVEIKAVLEKYGDRLVDCSCAGYSVKRCNMGEYSLVIVQSGAGEIGAAGATQLLISHFKVEMIVNYGVVGGLTPNATLAKVCVVEKAVHYDFDTSALDNCPVGQYTDQPDLFLHPTKSLVELAISLHPEIEPVICASGDKFIGDPEKKAALHKEYGAEICEMEAAAIIIIANRNHVPCLLIKSVSDSITGGAAEFTSEKDRAAAICLEITDKIIASL